MAYGLALAVVVWVLTLWRRERITWPVFVAIGGVATAFLEPLYDNLYGLRFPHEGQWTLYTAFGSAQPAWVPAVYLTIHGGATIVIARLLARRPTARTVWTVCGFLAVMMTMSDIAYVGILRV